MTIHKKGNHYETVLSYYVGHERHQKRIRGEKKKDVEEKAAEFISMHSDLSPDSDLRFVTAAKRYIEEKKAVLSPNTIKSYTGMVSVHFDDWEFMNLSDMTNSVIQRKISDLAKTKSPKTVANVNGFIHAVIAEYRPEFRYSVKLPQKKKPELYTPTDDEIRKILSCVSGTCMEIPIKLAAFGGLRQAEICALTIDDIGDGRITVSKSMAESGGKYIIKLPKTTSGIRTAAVPKSLTDQIKDQGFITDLNPNMIGKRYEHVVKGAGVTKHRFHDLRSYFASSLHYLGIPDQTIMTLGGWHDAGTMQGHYRRKLSDKVSADADLAESHFSKICD